MNGSFTAILRCAALAGTCVFSAAIPAFGQTSTAAAPGPIATAAPQVQLLDLHLCVAPPGQPGAAGQTYLAPQAPVAPQASVVPQAWVAPQAQSAPPAQLAVPTAADPLVAASSKPVVELAASDTECCNAGSHLVCSAEAVLLWPSNGGKNESYDIYNAQGGTVSHYSPEVAGYGQMAGSPRITLGIQNACYGWGIQTRFWQMNEAAAPNNFDIFTGMGSNAACNLQTQTVDLELCRLCELGCWTTQFTIGPRYGQFSQSLGINQRLLLTTPGAVPSQDLYSGSAYTYTDFSGVGITASVSGTRPVGCCGVQLFYSLRASELFDDRSNNYAQTWAAYNSPVNGSAASYNFAASTGPSSSMFVGEVQVGGEWDFELKRFPAHTFVRVALEYQYWGLTNSGFAQSTSFAGPISGALRGVATATSGDAFVNMIGLNLGAGLTW